MRHRESSWNRRHQGPDGPWAWLVISAVAWNLFWLSLLRHSAGVIFVALLSRFGESRERTSWVISLSMSLAILLGPLWGLLNKVLSLRTQTLLGCLIVGVSSVMCYFARSLTTVIILQGICGGIGQGIVMPTKELVIGYHFRRYHGSANGICFIGGILAAFVYPMILLLLIQEYNLGGALLITGGLQLHALAGSLFYRKPLWAQVQNGTEARRNSARLKPWGDDVNYMKGLEVSNMQEAPRAADMGHVSMSIIRPGSRKLAPCRNDDVTDAADGAGEDVREKGQRSSNLLHNDTDHKNRETNGSSASASAAVALLSNETGNAVEDMVTATCVDRKHEIRWTSSAGACDLGFLKHPVFYMILVTCSFSAFSMVTFTILVDYAKERNFSAQDGAILLSVKAIGDAISHPMSGLLPGRGLIDRRTLMCASQLTMAFSCALLPLAAHSYPALLVLCVLLGWSTSTVVVLFVPIMADRVGMASLGMSMGICRFAMGVGPLTCPLLIGYFKDQLGSYEGLFYLSSIINFMVGSLWLVDALRMVVTRRRRRRASAAVRWDAVPTSDEQPPAAVPS
ncbi:monocarboxylate transporter 14 isoform X1 [Rhipicephalus microplus]|uniref:monocarboxylate transporter 14 isoform X1 n=1 Tax=Rhipicephalus microplus TaxID=6941 RepID=UPI003F6C0107